MAIVLRRRDVHECASGVLTAPARADEWPVEIDCHNCDYKGSIEEFQIR